MLTTNPSSPAWAGVSNSSLRPAWANVARGLVPRPAECNAGARPHLLQLIPIPGHIWAISAPHCLPNGP